MLLCVVLAYTGRTNAVGSSIIVVNAYIVAAGLVIGASRVPRWSLPLVLGWGTTLITGVAYFSGQRPSPLIWFYLWIFLYSSYFFTRRQAAAQIGYVGVVYAVLLAVQPPGGAAAWWAVGMGTLLVTATLIWMMRDRAEALIAMLFDAARTDPLTKLLNRRGFRELLDLELERARRSDMPMAVLMGDIDHFKMVNDRCGHQGGDLALQRIAELLEGNRRQADVVCRAGGEEFALVLPATDQEGAFAAAERLRAIVLDEFADAAVPITISFGIAIFPDHCETAASLLRAADDALYEAKESGRNRCVLYALDAAPTDRSARRARDIQGEHFATVMLDLAAVVDLRFSGSARHSETVGRYAEMMASELRLPKHRVGRIRLAGLLHDIGKAGIPDAILNKNGPLTDEEFATIRTHPDLGAQLLEHASLSDVRSWVASHHEQPDGRGYPRGLSGAQVPLEARIVAVADAYEAMTSDRTYRASIGHARARAELRRCAGGQFDPMVVDALLTVLDRETDRARAGLSAA